MEQGHRRAQLQGIDAAHDRLGTRRVGGQDRRGAGPQALAQDRVRQVGPSLVERPDGVALGHPAQAEAGQLREHEPHPVAGFAPRGQLGQGAVVDPIPLGVEEALQVGSHHGVPAARRGPPGA